MKNQIVEKLRELLAGNIDSECKVVYLLCECRKLTSQIPPDRIPFALKMYSNWALHISLTKSGTTRQFLESIDAFAARVLDAFAARVVDDEKRVAEDYGVFRELVFLDSFRAQLRAFLADFGLPTALCDEDHRWHQFLTQYAGVIEDGSLSCHADLPSVKLVKKVVLTKGRATHDRCLPFSLLWGIILQDGGRIEAEVSAAPLPNGKHMIVNGIHLVKRQSTVST